METKRILILGAGMVSTPVIEYFRSSTPYFITVADQAESCVAHLKEEGSRIQGLCLDIQDRPRIEAEIKRSDLVVSLLPYTFHPGVAEICVRLGKSLITASYVSKEMNRLTREASDRGVLLLNEVGLDPGIDHMEAMRIIDSVRRKGGDIIAFTSFCGGLPAPEANTNPLGYKFSWSPTGVLQAGMNRARYLEEGSMVSVSPEHLFQNPRRVEIPAVGGLDGYPNRDSIPYIELYGISHTRTMLRGTLRYPGWCPFMQAARGLGYLDDGPSALSGSSYADDLRARLNIPASADLGDSLAARLADPADGEVVKTFEWLGLMSEDPRPEGVRSGLDVLASRMQERLQYAPGERDMIVLQHRFQVSYPGEKPEEITSTLIDYGIPDGDSSMARTVGLPVAVSARLVLEGRLQARGVQIPIRKEIYQPVLDELKAFGISFAESRINIV